MMIDIPEPVFDRLKKHAEPFVDTPVSVIERLLDFYEDHGNSGSRAHADNLVRGEVLDFPAHSAPDLTHTRLIAATFGNKAITPAKWNTLLRMAHETAFRTVGDFDQLAELTVAKIYRGAKHDEGYKPLNELGFSIQGVAANDAWRAVLHLARKLSVPVKAEFEWRVKEEAQHPGQKGCLAWTPSS